MSRNVIVAVYYTYFERFIVYKNTRRPCYVSEKAYNYTVQEISVVTFVKANGRVGGIPTYRVY